MIDEEILKTYNPRKNPWFIILGVTSLLLGIMIDCVIYKNTTVTAAYIPFMIMVGILSRFVTVNIFMSGLVASALQLFNHSDWMPELFFFRWMGYLLIAIVIRTLVVNNLKEQKNLISFTITLAASLDARDQYTAFHSRNVAYYSYKIGKALKLANKECVHLYIGGLLHDMGKIGVSEAILNKPSRLSAEEFEQLKKHPEIGYDMLKHVPAFKKNSILEMVLHHHEKVDGTGYPHGLKGESIPLVARIMAVADAFDAMTSNRVYRETKDLKYALDQLDKGKDKQFDSRVADVFLHLIQEGKIMIQGFKVAQKKVD
jgi:HD-GYP domain-containing protein (c-di-GMP phosphodiesterase class II)